MKNYILVGLLMFCVLSAARAQFPTKDNYPGTWNDADSWTSGQPSPLNTGINDEIDVYGYITRQGSLSFANIGKNSDEIIIYDTLVVQGDMTFENNSISLTVKTGGLLVVFGNFVANNKVDLANGGTMVITGDMTLSGGNQDYVDNGGGLYVDGVINGNGDTGDADGVDQPTSDLNNTGDNGEQSLYNFIQSGGSSSLPITLGRFELRSDEESVHLSWTTLSEENFSFFEVQRSSDGLHFDVIGRVSGHGFSSAAIDYVYLDDSPIYGKAYYRLNAVDYDGSNEIFQIVQVVYSPAKSIPNIYPNPSNGQVMSIQLNLDQTPRAQQLVVTDTRGRVIFESSNIMDFNQLSQRNLPNGLYFIRIQIDNLVFNKKLVVN